MLSGVERRGVGLADLLREQVDPRAATGPVYLVFSDGEVSMTRAGPLLGMRRLHTELAPVPLSPRGECVRLPWRWAGRSDLTFAAFEGREAALALCARVRELRLGPGWREVA